MRGVADRRHTRRDRGRVDVEWPANAVDGLDHVRRSVHPAKPNRCEAVDLRERAAHHDILGRGDELDPGLIVVAAHILRIGGVEQDRKSTRLNSSHLGTSYAVCCWKK